jgi:hypothetical protein
VRRGSRGGAGGLGAALIALAPACSTQSRATGTLGSTTTTAPIASADGSTTTTAPVASADGTGGAGTRGDAPTPSDAPFCARDTVAVGAAGASAFTVETAHYRLYAETARDRAVEMGRVLEAAFPALEAWFKAAPAIAGGLLQVKLYASEASWAAGLAADGIAVPSEAGGYFAPSTRAAYLFDQPNPYYTRVLLLHEAIHQFHELSRTRGQGFPFWYGEGHAEYLSRHDWDGHCIRLGAIPLLSWEDVAGQALTESQTVGIDVAAVVSGPAQASRPASWAVFRYLDTGPDHDRFQHFRDAFDHNLTDAAHSFASLVGDPASLSAPLAAWISDVQEPMKPIFTEWVHVGPRAAIGDSPGSFSLAIVKRAVTHFEAAYDVPAAAVWSAGLVVGYQDDKSYLAVLVSPDRKLRTFSSTGGIVRWNDAGTAPASSGATGTLAIDFVAGGTAVVTVNGASSRLSIGSLAPVAGLAISDSQVAFHDIGWK